MTDATVAIARALAAFFDSGAVPCPHAPRVQKAFLVDTDLTRASVRILAQSVADGGAAVIYAARTDRDFRAARRWCLAGVRLLVALLVDGAARDCLSDGKITPFIATPVGTLYALGMGPQYPAAHPRYAPHLCLVLTNEQQIREVPAEQRRRIREELVRRVGVVYDADDVWQPMQPVLKEIACPT